VYYRLSVTTTRTTIFPITSIESERDADAGIAAVGEQLFITTKLFRRPEGKTVRDTLVDLLAQLQQCRPLFIVRMPLQFYKEPGGLKAV